MDNPILTTKLNIPPVRGNLVRRSSIYGQLDEGLAPDKRLILISSPAGFGKTTLIAGWLADKKGKSLLAAWLTLEPGEDHPPAFLRYLVAALRKVRPDIGSEVLPLLDLPSLPSPEGLLAGLINDSTVDPAGLVIVLDDYHYITSQEVHTLVETLINHATNGFHLVILTRQDPPFALARMRARGQLIEIRQSELSFNDGESREFCNSCMGLALAPQQAVLLEQRTGGWITGLQIAALSLRGRANVDDFLESFGGSHPFIFDYLAGEVLHSLTPELVDFLTRTSVLSRMCASLADALTGRQDSQALLQQLEQSNLFLTGLDDQRRWYAYHPLFADFLRQRLAPGQSSALALLAAGWCEAHTTLAEAISYAIASGDVQATARLVRMAGPGAIRNGAMNELRTWLEAIPEEIIRQDAELAILKGWVAMVWNLIDLDQAASYAADGEKSLGEQNVENDPQKRRLRGRLLGLQAYLAHARYDEVKAGALASEAADFLIDDDPLYRATVLSLLGQVQRQLGEAKSGLETMREATRAGEQIEQHLGNLVAYANIIATLNVLGKRHEAVDYFESVIKKLTDARGRQSPLAFMIELPRAILCYEANDLAEARQILDKGFEDCWKLGFNPITMGGRPTSVLVRAAQGDLPGAIEEAQALYREAGQYRIEWVADMGRVLEVNLEMRAGNLEPANAWVGARALDLDHPDPAQEEVNATLARWLLAIGRPQVALDLLNRMTAQARQQERVRSLITLQILTAASLKALGNSEASHKAFEEALHLAAPQDYLRAFLDEGSIARKSLEDSLVLGRGDPLINRFARALLGLFETERTSITGIPLIYDHRKPGPPSDSLVEPLTAREVEVLGLIAQGLSNPQITQVLFITVNTLKAHTNTIYSKLDVHSRMEAVVKARSLGIIP